jgi:hypothetical protein
VSRREEWSAVQLLIGIDLPLKEAEYRSADYTGVSFNGQNNLVLLDRFVNFDFDWWLILLEY